MSSIIKSERIRNQSIINLSERFKAIHIEYEKDEEDEAGTESLHTHDEITDLEASKEADKLAADSYKAREVILNEANQAAYRIIEEAKQRAEEILSDALAKADEIKEESRIKQAQILCDAQAKGEEILEEAASQSEFMRKQAEEEKRALIMSSEEEVVNVLQSLLSHIISEELFENTQWMKCMVRKMLQECHTKEEIKVCFSAQLLERLTESQREEIRRLGSHIIIEGRNSLNETTCLVETKEGNILYDVAQGLERVVSEIKTLEKLS